MLARRAEGWRDFARIDKPFNVGQRERALMRILGEPIPAPPEVDGDRDLSDTVQQAWDTIRKSAMRRRKRT